MAKLQSFNSVFQAELLTLNKATEWANSYRFQAIISSDNKSGLHALSSFYSRLKLVQDAQFEILKNLSLKLGWVKAHPGVFGNEMADQLARNATKNGDLHNIPTPKSHLESILHKIAINK
ncbi:hypothetical protein AVEN_207117-1 [Araneus ventricosus]|uniref:RNase H type-1 domain-containing protein n=1 Tax=Araneus ventricosus TaxID=182803 RepID=A0A4Y2JE91_ARAVE|nr:hypothetical protein AVEN_207117-1 [Araneus ventricosus]